MKKTVVSLLSLLFVFLISFQAHAVADSFNNKVSGSVVDSESGEALKGVKVFLSETTFSTTTDEKGNYKIENIQPGLYKVVFRHKGYKVHVVELYLGKNKAHQFDAGLMERPFEKAMKSEGSAEEREKNFQRFREILIGETRNAEQTTILNPSAVNLFIDNENRLHAQANQEIHVINKAMGYELFLTVQTFSWNLKKDAGQFLNLVRINELSPDSPEEEKLWAANRARVYEGSLKKFLNELVHDKASFKNQRWAYQIGSFGVKAWGLNSGELVEVDKNKIEDNAHLKDLYSNINIYNIKPDYHSTSTIAVVPNYHSRFQLTGYYKHNRGNYVYEKDKISYLGHINKGNSKYLIVDNFGNLLNPLEVTLSGHWAQQRMANYLPFNYQPTSTSLASR